MSKTLECILFNQSELMILFFRLNDVVLTAMRSFEMKRKFGAGSSALPRPHLSEIFFSFSFKTNDFLL